MSLRTSGSPPSPPVADPVTVAPWQRRDWLRTGGLLAVIAAAHVAAWVVLLTAVVPRHYLLGTKVFGLGLGVTAYVLGVRHAFDADHIAAIDNTTRKLMVDGRRPVSVGFWFALGHSSVVVALATLIAVGAREAAVLTDGGSGAHQVLGLVSTSVSGGFLYLIGLLNLFALAGIVRIFKRMRRGEYDAAGLEATLNSRGFFARFLGALTRSITRPGQMYPVGLLFGIGFDTATEVTLLVLAGSGAASGLPWYAVLVLPLLFAAGMSLFDTLDGLFMTFAYRWAFANPVRKVYYNLTITGLSVAVALLIGTIELVGVLHDRLGLTDPVTRWISGLDLNNVGFLVAGMFVVVWAAAIGYWRLAGIEQRWPPPAVATTGTAATTTGNATTTAVEEPYAAVAEER
jgi:high-affinity nickel-transport protein